jgi:hypothetical protein
MPELRKRTGRGRSSGNRTRLLVPAYPPASEGEDRTQKN